MMWLRISWTLLQWLCHACSPLLQVINVYLTALIRHQGTFRWWLEFVDEGPFHWDTLTPLRVTSDLWSGTFCIDVAQRSGCPPLWRQAGVTVVEPEGRECAVLEKIRVINRPITSTRNNRNKFWGDNYSKKGTWTNRHCAKPSRRGHRVCLCALLSVSRSLFWQLYKWRRHLVKIQVAPLVLHCVLMCPSGCFGHQQVLFDRWRSNEYGRAPWRLVL